MCSSDLTRRYARPRTTVPSPGSIGREPYRLHERLRRTMTATSHEDRHRPYTDRLVRARRVRRDVTACFDVFTGELTNGALRRHRAPRDAARASRLLQTLDAPTSRARNRLNTLYQRTTTWIGHAALDRTHLLRAAVAGPVGGRSHPSPPTCIPVRPRTPSSRAERA